MHSKSPVAYSLEELYRGVEDLCIHRLGDALFRRLQGELDAHAASQVAALAAQMHLLAPSFLRAVDQCWSDLCQGLLTIRSVFLYLDRSLVLAKEGMRSLYDLGLGLFRNHLRERAGLERKVVADLLEVVARERRGEAVDRQLLRAVSRMMQALGLFQELVEPDLIRATTEFYRAEGAQQMGDSDVPEYLLHCERRLAEESDRAASYLDTSTRRPLVQAVERELVEAHATALLDKGAVALLEGRRLQDLARLYNLLGRVGAQPQLKATWAQFIRKAGSSIVADEAKDKEMVGLLLELRAKVDEILLVAFGRNDQFAQTAREAFVSFINTRQNKPAELIARYVDGLLKTGNKGVSDEELERGMDHAMVLFKYIQGKDVFEAFYKKDLAKRLLLGRSASEDAEKRMIALLKEECGSQFTAKLEGMFKDIRLSRELMQGFRDSDAMQARLPAGLEASVHVLTAGFWPTYPPLELQLPEEVARVQQAFGEFYLNKHSGRGLSWHNSLGQCMLKARFASGVKELQVSLTQCVVLLMFQDQDEIAYPDLRKGTGIEDKELRRTLQSLACGQVRVLEKHPKGRDVADSDVFRFNHSFSHKLVRIKINQIQLKETEEENQKTNEEVLRDRQYMIDAAIVRIMKARKTMGHKLLISELLQQIRVNVQPTDIKKRIESLIDREFLERSAADPQIYNYLA